MSTTTKELLRKYPLTNSPYLDTDQELLHKRRLARYLGPIEGALEVSRDIMSKLEDSGFRLWADFDLLVKMPHVAQLGLRNTRPCVFSREAEIYYSGDIPEFALDRVDLVRKVGLEYITIHSTNPLPVRRVRVERVRKVDPIMVAWVNNPQIRLPSLPRHRKVRFLSKDLKGLVVAMWDMDKELNP